MPKPCHQCGKRESKQGYLFCAACLPAVRNRVRYWAQRTTPNVRTYTDKIEKDNRLYRREDGEDV